MIRLGSLAGYPFEGPRVLGGWQPPSVGAVYVILYLPDADGKPHDFAVIDVDHAEHAIGLMAGAGCAPGTFRL